MSNPTPSTNTHIGQDLFLKESKYSYFSVNPIDPGHRK